MPKLLIKDIDTIATMDDKGHELHGTHILIDPPVIERMGADVAAPPGATIIDGRGKVALPGFVNTHHHMFQIYTRDLPAVMGAVDLWDWLRRNSRAWVEMDSEMVYASAGAALGLLLKNGCTLVSDDHYLFPAGADARMIDAAIRAAQEIGVKFHPVRASISDTESARQLYPATMLEDDRDVLADCERLIRQYHDPAPFSRLRIGVGPVSMVAASEGLLQESIALARQHGLRAHTHLAESAMERDWCLERHGMRPFDYLERSGWVGPDVWYAHCLLLNEGEIRRMGQHDCGVAHCPVSNGISGHIAPIFDFLSAGAHVGLGVDGGAGFGDMWAELQAATVLHTYNGSLGGEFASLGEIARAIMRIATRGGAEVLGWEAVGSLEPGKAADITLIDRDQLDYAGCRSDPVAALALFGANHMADSVLINGEVVVEGGRLLKVDEEVIARQANALADDLLKRIPR
jgi:8-oxoguanine deaminase